VAFQPAFVIGGIIPSRAGFQPCISLPGFIGIWSDLEKKWYPRSDHPCAVGNVTVTQTNRLLNPTGKKVRLLVTSVDYMIYTFGPFSELSIYELPLPNNYVTFQVVFASGKNLERAYDGVSDKDYLNQVFAQGKPLKIEALYDGTSYATLNCTFRSPNKVDCP